jgi:hypothetical protein
MDYCNILLFSLAGSCCVLCICMYCIQIHNIDNCCNRRSFCTSSRVSNISNEVVIQQPGLPKYGEEVIYNKDMFVDENEIPPPKYLP